MRGPRYWYRRAKICARRSARKLDKTHITSERVLSSLKIFIFVGFGYLLGLYTAQLELSRCEINIEQLSHENTRTLLQIQEEHNRQLETQRNAYQKIIKESLAKLGDKVDQNQEMIKRNHQAIDENGEKISANKDRIHKNAMDISNRN